MPKVQYPTTTTDWRAVIVRRRRWYILAALLLAVGFGLLSFRIYYLEHPSLTEPQGQAVFSTREITAGSQLTEEMLEIRRVPESLLPAAYYRGIEGLIGKEVLHDFVSGEILTPGDLLRGMGGPTAAQCPMKSRCISIPFHWFMASPPELYAGDWIDIAAVHPGQQKDELGFLAANVRVVAVRSQEEGDALILAVDEREALAISYARAQDYQLFLLVQSLGGR